MHQSQPPALKLINSRREMGEVKRESGKRTTLYMEEFERRIEQEFSSVQFSSIKFSTVK